MPPSSLRWCGVGVSEGPLAPLMMSHQDTRGEAVNPTTLGGSVARWGRMNTQQAHGFLEPAPRPQRQAAGLGCTPTQLQVSRYLDNVPAAEQSKPGKPTTPSANTGGGVCQRRVPGSVEIVSQDTEARVLQSHNARVEWPRPEGLVIGKLQWSWLCSSAIRQCVPSQCLSAGVKGHHLNGQSSAPTPQTLSTVPHSPSSGPGPLPALSLTPVFANHFFPCQQWTASQARTMVAGPGAQLPHRPGPEEAGGWVLGEPLSRLKYGGAR
ncbi:unnamed protein product [Gadus morhua 'NCC']